MFVEDSWRDAGIESFILEDGFDWSWGVFISLKHISFSSYFCIVVIIDLFLITCSDVFIFVSSYMQAVKIEAYVCKEDPITKNIVPGGVYKFSIFQVTCNHGVNRVTNHRYKLLLHSRTMIFPSVESSIPFDGFDFLDIGHIRRDFDTFTYLIGFNFS